MSNLMEVLSSCIRGCIISPPGKKLVVSDLSNIEGRAAAWIANEKWKLDAFRNFDLGVGHDLYKLAYAKAFQVTPESVTKDQRQVGKVMELMLQYEGGVGAFLTGAAAYGIDLDKMADVAWSSVPPEIRLEAERALVWAKDKKRTYGLSDRAYIVCDALKRMWREAHPAISGFWKKLEDSAINAVGQKGTTIACGKLKVRCDGAWLRIQLPSGRALCYASPKVVDGKLTYCGTNQFTRKWTVMKTYGGKIFENAIQGCARDIMAHAMIPIEKRGFQIVLSVHDELITEAPDTEEFNEKLLSKMLSTPPAWGEDIPLAAGGFEGYRYKKGD